MDLKKRIQLASTKGYRGRAGKEESLTMAIANALRVRMIEKGDVGPWCHVPNEGERHKLVGMKLRQMGLMPGFPDLIFPAPGSLGVELKIKPNKTTESQNLVREWCDTFAVEYEVCHSAEEFNEVFNSWLRREGLGTGRPNE